MTKLPLHILKRMKQQTLGVVIVIENGHDLISKFVCCKFVC
jgi:hypothetical protein